MVIYFTKLNIFFFRIFIARFDMGDKDNWIFRKNFMDLDDT